MAWGCALLGWHLFYRSIRCLAHLTGGLGWCKYPQMHSVYPDCLLAPESGFVFYVNLVKLVWNDQCFLYRNVWSYKLLWVQWLLRGTLLYLWLFRRQVACSCLYRLVERQQGWWGILWCCYFYFCICRCDGSIFGHSSTVWDQGYLLWPMLLSDIKFL